MDDISTSKITPDLVRSESSSPATLMESSTFPSTHTTTTITAATMVTTRKDLAFPLEDPNTFSGPKGKCSNPNLAQHMLIS